MRKDAKIYSDLDRFAFLGFSIRKRGRSPLRYNKPSTELVTVDVNLCALHPMFDDDFPEEDINGTPNILKNIQSSYHFIENAYRSLDNITQSEYRIYGYAIELDMSFRYIYEFYDYNSKPPELLHSMYKFAYAVRNIIQPIGEFRGFDVVDGEVEWTSGLTNCGIHWSKAEECGELNKYHLFSRYEDAKRFRAVADKLVQEHSPFAVWAVFEVML